MSKIIFPTVQSDPIRDLKVCLLTSDFCIVPLGLFPYWINGHVFDPNYHPPQFDRALGTRWHFSSFHTGTKAGAALSATMPGNDDDEDIVGKRHWNHDADGIDNDNATNTYKMTGTAGM